MTAGLINYRKKAREDFKNCTAFDDALWEVLQKMKVEDDYRRAVRKYLREKPKK